MPDITIPGIQVSLDALPGGVGRSCIPGVYFPLINIRYPVSITLNELPFNVAGIFTGLHRPPSRLTHSYWGVTLAGGTQVWRPGIQCVNPVPV